MFILQIALPFICIAMIVIAVLSFKTTKKPTQKGVPPEIIAEFTKYASDIVSMMGADIIDAKVSKLYSLAQFPYDNGMFEFCSMDFEISTSKPIVTQAGIYLNSKEIFARGGIKEPIVLFYRQGEKVYEVTCMDKAAVMVLGYKAFVDSKYINFRQKDVKEEYAITINDEKVTLWDNIKDNPPFTDATISRARSAEVINNSQQNANIWEGKGIKVNTWQVFESKKDYIYMIRVTGNAASTVGGIHVGSSIDDLKEAYPKDLAYSSDFKGAGKCYGYIPPDGTTNYIAFFVNGDTVSEIWITDAFEARPFEIYKGYVFDDVPWEACDYSDKLTERYAREIYLGQHKSDLDADKVFMAFISHLLGNQVVREKGLWKESPGRRIYYIICEEKDGNATMNYEIKMERIRLKSVSGEEIWVVTHYRSQKKKYKEPNE